MSSNSHFSKGFTPAAIYLTLHRKVVSRTVISGSFVAENMPHSMSRRSIQAIIGLSIRGNGSGKWELERSILLG